MIESGLKEIKGIDEQIKPIACSDRWEDADIMNNFNRRWILGEFNECIIQIFEFLKTRTCLVFVLFCFVLFFVLFLFCFVFCLFVFLSLQLAPGQWMYRSGKLLLIIMKCL